MILVEDFSYISVDFSQEISGKTDCNCQFHLEKSKKIELLISLAKLNCSKLLSNNWVYK